MPDTYKEIPGFNGNYRITKEGIVNSITRIVKGSPQSKSGLRVQEGRTLKKVLFKTGYYCIFLSKNSSSKPYLLHRLIAMSFIPNPDNKPCINHIDGIKTNNSIANLEWVTYKENNEHARNTGLTKLNGLDNAMSKLDQEKTKEIELLIKGGEQLKAICSKYNISGSTFNRVKNKTHWTQR